MHHEDKIFFRNFFYTVSVLALIMVFFLITARTVAIPADDAPDTAAVDERTRPVGQLRVADESGGAPEQMTTDDAVVAAADGGAPDGAQVFQGLCMSCHGSGIPGIPQLGEAAVWEPRIAKGMDALYANAINGYVGESGIPMPARGGNPALSDDEVKAAVDYMVEAVK